MSAALGIEKATLVVADAFVALGIQGARVDRATGKQVLEHLSRAAGLVGITGRVALSRFEHGARNSSVLRSTDASPSAPSASPSARRSLSLVVGLLAPTLGQERAANLVHETADAMHLPEQIQLEEALVLLEKITRMSGVIGVAARFAKTRIHLSW
jgi:hypothetical protein